MSIQTEINRITRLRDEQTTLLETQGVSINDIKEALQNKCTGTDPVLQEKTIAPSTSSQNVTADSGYDGLSKVVVSAVTSAIDSDIKATNIKKGVNILGVTGTLEEGITPSGTINITTNGTHNVTNYASASVNVPSEDLSSELNTYENYLSTQETTIDSIITALQGKASGGGGSVDNTLIESLINRTITSIRTEVVEVGQNVFYGCNELTSIDAPNATILYDAFARNCKKLVSINIPKATQIRGYGLAGCTGLTTLDLPVATTMYANALNGCTGLTKLIIRTGSVCSISSNTLTGSSIASGTGYVYVPDNLVSSYKSATNWSNYASQIKGLSEL